MKVPRPNICLTVADDQRASALGCAGVEQVMTPHLDALAAGGIRYSHAFHLGSCHGGICSPSRAMLHTGVPYHKLDPKLMGQTYADEPFEIPPTLGQKLQGQGYETFATGKWHNGVASHHISFSSGAQIFFGGMCDHWHVPVFDYDPTGKYEEGNQYYADGMSTELFAQAAIDFIHSRKDNPEPFFCYCAFTAPHDPRTPPDHWRRQYNRALMKRLPNMIENPVTDTGVLGIRDERLSGIPRLIEESMRALAAYYGMISHMDEWIGKIHDAIKEIGAWDNTLVVHTADHGLAVGQHGLLGKQNEFDHSIRVPLILSGPGVALGEVREQLVYQHDLHPTLMERAGLSEEGYFQSLNPSLKDASTSSREFIGNSYEDLMRMIRSRQHKLIEYTVKGDHRKEFYNLDEDPWEMNNRADDPGCYELIKTFGEALRSWQGHVGDEHELPGII